MDLQDFDLDRLTILWQASSGNLDFRNLIENELQNRIVNNDRFSREYLFQVCKVNNRVITISFIPTSEAYNRYGSHVTVDINLTDEELEEMIKNYHTNPPINSTGQIRARAVVTDNLSTDQIRDLAEIGFHTNEILETLHL